MKDDFFNKLLHTKHRMLFLPATPRIYDLEGTDEDDTFEDIFGKIIYKIDFCHAIEKIYICDLFFFNEKKYICYYEIYPQYLVNKIYLMKGIYFIFIKNTL